jgi:hypothetical protein|tara:strand:- start:488 stop:1795 length:1308 start_codon:yes stop_codon:yes gene_type:complete
VANTIRIKRSTGSSAPTTLENAELAFSEGNEIGYVGVGTGGAGGSATTINKAFGKGAFFDKDTVRTTNHVLAGAASGSSAAPTFRALVAADIPSIAHTKISDFDTGVRTNRLDQMTAPTGSVSFNSQNITNVADPVNAQDAATKGFVEATSQGLNVKNSCVAATTGNITISTALNNGDTLDGVTLSTNDRVLVKDQSTASQNGIYVVAASPARAADLAAGANAAGMFTFVEKGTTNADNGFVCTSDSGSAVVGTNNLTFAQFSGAGQITAGDGLDKSGNTLSVDLKANGGLVIESTEIAVKLDASSITGTLAIGDGGTGATSASAARTALGLAIGTNVQAYDADLDNLSGCQSGASAALALLTSTEVAILDGATVSTAELNIIDGSTSATSTTLAAADRMVINDAGTMVQVALTDLVTFLENGSVSGFDIDGGTY